MSQRLVPTIHAHGEAGRLDGVLELVAFSARPRPLSVGLDELPRRLAKIFACDVCSIYLLERDVLVMRGNIGFPSAALGEVRLAVGQGVTGLAVEYMRPISLNTASTHASYQHFPTLGEDKFPVFLAVPISGPNGPLGAMVLQRRTAPGFDATDIELASALTAPIAAIAERARLVDELRDGVRPSGRGTRRITLSGRTAVAGRALGMVRALPRPQSRPQGSRRGRPQELATGLDQAIAQAHRALDAAEKESRRSGNRELGYFQVIHTILEDARLRERALELSARGKGTASALLDLGAEALRTAQQLGSDFGVERAKLIAEVCEALSMLLTPDWRSDVPPGAVLVGNQFTAFDLLVSSQLRPSAVVLAEHTGDPLSRQLLTLVNVPAVVDVPGLFRWSHDGELALVDADHGIVRLNPSRMEVAALRHEKKQARG